MQVIFFAVLLGIGIIKIGEKAEPVKVIFNSLSEVMYTITNMIVKLTPLGVLGLIAPIIGFSGTSVLMPPLLKVIIGMIIAISIHILFVYSMAIYKFGRMSLVRFFKGIFPAAIVAFSTCSSSGALPVTKKCRGEFTCT
jgi:Na+/H+-dicarboxylate symporter